MIGPNLSFKVGDEVKGDNVEEFAAVFLHLYEYVFVWL